MTYVEVENFLLFLHQQKKHVFLACFLKLIIALRFPTIIVLPISKFNILLSKDLKLASKLYNKQRVAK